MESQQAIVHKDAVQTVPQHLVNKDCSYSAVHATRQGTDSMRFWAHLSAPHVQSENAT